MEAAEHRIEMLEDEVAALRCELEIARENERDFRRYEIAKEVFGGWDAILRARAEDRFGVDFRIQHMAQIAVEAADVLLEALK